VRTTTQPHHRRSTCFTNVSSKWPTRPDENQIIFFYLSDPQTESEIVQELKRMHSWQKGQLATGNFSFYLHFGCPKDEDPPIVWHPIVLGLISIKLFLNNLLR
jgi:hypothetical protein